MCVCMCVSLGSDDTQMSGGSRQCGARCYDRGQGGVHRAAGGLKDRFSYCGQLCSATFLFKKIYLPLPSPNPVVHHLGRAAGCRRRPQRSSKQC